MVLWGGTEPQSSDSTAASCRHLVQVQAQTFQAWAPKNHLELLRNHLSKVLRHLHWHRPALPSRPKHQGSSLHLFAKAILLRLLSADHELFGRVAQIEGIQPAVPSKQPSAWLPQRQSLVATRLRATPRPSHPFQKSVWPAPYRFGRASLQAQLDSEPLQPRPHVRQLLASLHSEPSAVG